MIETILRFFGIYPSLGSEVEALMTIDIEKGEKIKKVRGEIFEVKNGFAYLKNVHEWENGSWHFKDFPYVVEHKNCYNISG